MSEYTPGPWTVEPVGECLSYLSPVAVEEGIIRHVIVGSEPEEFYIAPVIGDIPAAEANAYLIAAAPDLLEALEAISALLASSPSSGYETRLTAALDTLDKARELARAAISRATPPTPEQEG